MRSAGEATIVVPPDLVRIGPIALIGWTICGERLVTALPELAGRKRRGR